MSNGSHGRRGRMEKVIKADINCLLNTISNAVESENLSRALEASAQLHERIADLQRVTELRQASKEVI